MNPSPTGLYLFAVGRGLDASAMSGVKGLDGSALEARHLAVPSHRVPTELEKLDQLPLAGLKLSCLERAAIEQTLRLTAGNKAHAAELLGIAPSTLYEKLKKYQKG